MSFISNERFNVKVLFQRRAFTLTHTHMSFNFLWPGSKFSPFLKIKSTHLLASSETKNKTKNIKFYNVTFLNESSTRGHFLFLYKFLAFLFSIFFLKQLFIDIRGLVFSSFWFQNQNTFLQHCVTDVENRNRTWI